MYGGENLPRNKYPEENNKYRVDEHSGCGGGPASNAGYLLALWGQNVSFQGVVQRPDLSFAVDQSEPRPKNPHRIFAGNCGGSGRDRRCRSLRTHKYSHLSHG